MIESKIDLGSDLNDILALF